MAKCLDVVSTHVVTGNHEISNLKVDALGMKATRAEDAAAAAAEEKTLSVYNTPVKRGAVDMLSSHLNKVQSRLNTPTTGRGSRTPSRMDITRTTPGTARSRGITSARKAYGTPVAMKSLVPTTPVRSMVSR